MMHSIQTEIDSLASLARIGFEEDLYRLMQAEQITRSELARRIESSSAYISKVLNGTSNYTLQTMAKLAEAVGAIVQIRLVLEGREAVRVLSIKDAQEFDDRNADKASDSEDLLASVTYFDFRGDGGRLRSSRISAGDTGVGCG